MLGDDGRYVETSRRSGFGRDFVPGRIQFSNFIPLIALAHRRSLFDVVGPFDETFDLFEDWDFMIRLAGATRRGGRAALARAYRHIPAVSIDTGVMERAQRVAVVRADFPWSDVGSWAAVGELWRGTRADANATRGRVVAVESRGCVVDSPERLVALLGVDDLVVVDTPDAVLVCRLDRAQDVRRVEAELRRRGLGRYL